MLIPSTTAGFAAVILLAAWLLYRFIVSNLYPRVLPGLPHNARHKNRPFGDLPAVESYASETGCTRSEAVFEVVNRGPTQSPIAQLLTPGFMRHAILMIDDPREVEDILRRRGRELDRSSMTTAFFAPLLPKASISLFTTPELKAQKKLWADSITSDFLSKVVAPHACRTADRLVGIWRLKAARGGSFETRHDFLDATTDLMWAIVLGSDLGVQSDKLSSMAKDWRTFGAGGTADSGPGELQKAAKLSRDMFFQVTSLLERESSYVRRGSAAWRLKLTKLTPTYRRVKRSMDREMAGLVAAARERFRRLGSVLDSDKEARCAMDLVLRREMLAAGKEDSVRPGNIEQELMLFMIAGIDSTAFTMSWCVKLLSKHTLVQDNLRTALQAALHHQPDSNFRRAPSAQDIASTEIPYLDAFLHETLRLANTAGSVVRRAAVDTHVLGCRVPAGTELVLNTRVLRPPIPVDENLRSVTCREAQRKRPRGGIEGPSGEDLQAFNPRRWLYRDGDRDVFDPEALPTLVFSHGTRGCFGKRLAMLDLRVFVVVLVLNFKFLPIPDEQDSWAADEAIFQCPKQALVRLEALD